MKILSIDVGIKNLAFCLFFKEDNCDNFTIKKWDIINIAEHDTFKCIFVEKNNITCDKPAKFKKNNDCFCLKHSKKQTYQIPTTDLKPTFINKQKIQKLHEIANKYSIKYETPIKKAELVSLLNEYINNTCFQEIKNTDASKVDLVNIGANIMYKFDILFKEEVFIDHVIIENQISPIANRMKTIQGMIVQYFIMSEVKVDNIEFISASNKLKDCLKEKEKVKEKEKEKNKNTTTTTTTTTTTYSERKKLGISRCLEILHSEYNFASMIEYFNKHNKKDDLADSFLQGMWFIKNKMNSN
jgi:hypothetical protein